jgi:TPR repeat protein
MRDRSAFVVFVHGALACSALVLSGCPAGAVAKAVRPNESKASEAISGHEGPAAPEAVTCAEIEETAQPLVVDWKPDQRADLEVLMTDTVVVVSYSCTAIKVLRDCRLDGSYAFKSVTLKEQVIRLEDADEVRANLPISGGTIAANLKADFDAGTTLDLATVYAGKHVAARRSAWRGELQGKCDGATHFVRGVTVGAFALQTGTKASFQTAAQIFTASVGAGTASSRMARSQDGDMSACKAAAPGGKPPTGCSAIIRLELTGVSENEADAARPEKGEEEVQDRPAARCSKDMVLAEGKCTKPKKEVTHECKAGDAKDCEEQCQRGSAGSCGILGTMYAYGYHVSKDPAKSVPLLKTACDKDLFIACRELGHRHARGEGVAQDYIQAVPLYKRACEGGDAAACLSIGSLLWTGKGLAKDEKKAADYFQSACNAGSGSGCSALGVAYQTGKGIAKDELKAASLYQRACEGGAAVGCVNLGFLYDSGKALAKDESKAFGLHAKACKLGSAPGCRQAGLHYLAGKGTKQDKDKALELLGQACKASDTAACGDLKKAEADAKKADADAKKTKEKAEADAKKADATVGSKADGNGGGSAKVDSTKPAKP